MLSWNKRKVQDLDSLEIWFFILGRVLVGIAMGIFLSEYLKDIADLLKYPLLIMGLVFLIVASKGLFRRKE